MAEGGIGNQSPATLFQARLRTTPLGVSNTLTLGQYLGNKVVVSGYTVVIPSAGLTRDIADHLIDAGSAPAASTLYYVYISNQRSAFSPSAIRLSATAPTLVNGVRYLGASGNALNWRFVGWVRPNATPQFESSAQNALIVNQYNQREQSIFNTPGYDDSTDFASFGVSNTAAWAAANGGVNSRISYISDGERPAKIRCAALLQAVSPVGGGIGVGIGVDSTTLTSVQSQYDITNPAIATIPVPPFEPTLAEGYHTIDMLAIVSGPQQFIFTTTIKAGNPTHPFCTVIEAVVWV